MGVFARLKRLWELSKEPEEVTEEELDFALTEQEAKDAQNEVEQTAKPRGMATVVQDDPLDVFPSDEQEPEQPSETE